MIKGQIVYNRNGKEGTASFEFNGSRDELEQYISRQDSIMEELHGLELELSKIEGQS